MTILDVLFGVQVPLVAKMLMIFGLIFGAAALVWFVGRRLLPGPSVGTTAGRGRQPRLGVLDAHAVDARRKLVLVRRDNVEHLIMIGGPNDVVIESTILRGRPQAQPGAQPASAQPSPALARATPLIPSLVQSAETIAAARSAESDMTARLEDALRRPAPPRSTPPPPAASGPASARPARSGPIDLDDEDLFDAAHQEEASSAAPSTPLQRELATPPPRDHAAAEERPPPAVERLAPRPRVEPRNAAEAPRAPAEMRAEAAPAPQPTPARPSSPDLRVPELRLPELRRPEPLRRDDPSPEPPVFVFEPQLEDDPPHADPPAVITLPPLESLPERVGPSVRTLSQIPSFAPRLRRESRPGAAARPVAEEPPAPSAAPDPFASLEEEMASLLGRNSGQSKS